MWRMTAREVIYCGVSSIFDSFIRPGGVARFLSLFTFQSRDHRLLDPGIKSWLRRFGPPIAGVTIFLLLIVNGGWSALNGRFLGDADPVTRNFLEDWPNVFNYLVVCPAYVVLGLCFLFHCPSLRGSLDRTGLVRLLDVQEFSSHLTPQKGVVIGGVVLLASLVSISNFASELERYKFLFWFQRPTQNLDRVLSAHGYYYLLTNVFLNLLVVLVVVAHAELFSVASKVGEAMKAQARRSEPPPGDLLNKAAVIKLFQPFTSLYVVSKVLVVVFIVNMYTWKAQKPGFTGTLDFTIVLLALLGVAVVSYPRYHLQYWLFKLWQRGDVPEYPDIRSPMAAGLASFADILVLGGAMTNLVAYVLEKSGISLKLF